MKYPVLTVNREKFIVNVKYILNFCRRNGIDPHLVTKAFCAYTPMVEAMAEAGACRFADSRTENLKKLQGFGTSRMLLRLPMISEADEVVRLADISLNSGYETIRALSEAARRQNRRHGVLLMAELGDLREGAMTDDLPELAQKTANLPCIDLLGVGANLNCYGGVIPDEENLGRLVYAARRIEDRLNVKLPYVSGGNSGSIYLLNESRLPKGINHLRIGEAMLLGRETSFGRRISGMADDVFTLKTEVIECIVKPSVPFGKVGLNAFGQKTEVADRGLRKRAIVACGRQDTICADLVPRDGKIQFIGASSDHMILDVTDCKKEIKAGDIIEFSLTYGTLLAAFTSEYIHKEVV